MLATKLDIVLKSAKDALDSAPAPVAEKSVPVTQSLAVDGFESSSVFTQIHAGLSSASDAEKEQFIRKAKAIFQFDIKVCLEHF